VGPDERLRPRELVGVARDVDRGDEAVIDLERGRLQDAVELDRDIARQAVDPGRAEEAVADARRDLLAGEAGEESGDWFAAEERPRRGGDFAAAIGSEDRRFRQ